MKTKSIRLGHLESKLIFTLEEKGIKFFDFTNTREILGAPDASVRDVLFRLRKKDRISRLEKGKYSLNPAKSGLEGHWAELGYLVADYLLEDYYIGFWSALQYWGWTEQIPQILFVATPEKKKSLNYGGQKIRFITISRKRFFGSTTEWTVQEESFRVASREKAILDALLYPQHCGGIVEAAKAVWYSQPVLEWAKLLQHLEKLKVSSVKRRLGYLLQVLGLREDIRESLKEDFRGFRWLDPSREKKVMRYSKEWGLQLNLAEEELLSWRLS